MEPLIGGPPARGGAMIAALKTRRIRRSSLRFHGLAMIGAVAVVTEFEKVPAMAA